MTIERARRGDSSEELGVRAAGELLEAEDGLPLPALHSRGGGAGAAEVRVGFGARRGDRHPYWQAVLAGARRAGVAVGGGDEAPRLDAGDGTDSAMGGEQQLVAGRVVDPVARGGHHLVPLAGRGEVLFGPAVEVADDVPGAAQRDRLRFEDHACEPAKSASRTSSRPGRSRGRDSRDRSRCCSRPGGGRPVLPWVDDEACPRRLRHRAGSSGRLTATDVTCPGSALTPGSNGWSGGEGGSIGWAHCARRPLSRVTTGRFVMAHRRGPIDSRGNRYRRCARRRSPSPRTELVDVGGDCDGGADRRRAGPSRCRLPRARCVPSLQPGRPQSSGGSIQRGSTRSPSARRPAP